MTEFDYHGSQFAFATVGKYFKLLAQDFSLFGDGVDAFFLSTLLRDSVYGQLKLSTGEVVTVGANDLGIYLQSGDRLLTIPPEDGSYFYSQLRSFAEEASGFDSGDKPEASAVDGYFLKASPDDSAPEEVFVYNPQLDIVSIIEQQDLPALRDFAAREIPTFQPATSFYRIDRDLRGEITLHRSDAHGRFRTPLTLSPERFAVLVQQVGQLLA